LLILSLQQNFKKGQNSFCPVWRRWGGEGECEGVGEGVRNDPNIVCTYVKKKRKPSRNVRNINLSNKNHRTQYQWTRSNRRKNIRNREQD
jgi:hypothetical protein